MGADVIKIERPGVGDITRGQLRDVPNADSLYFTMLNGNKRSITVELQAPQGQGDHRAADQALRRAGGELRARRARPHGLHLRAHPRAQPAHDRRLGQGLRPGPVRGLQGLRERRPVRRRLRLDHRLPRGPAARHRRADRRFRHRPASRARHRRARSISACAPAAASGCSPPCRTACSTSPASSCATSSASRTARSRNTASSARASRSARRCRAPATIRAAVSPAGSSSARAGRPIPTPTSISSPRRRCGKRSAT